MIGRRPKCIGAPPDGTGRPPAPVGGSAALTAGRLVPNGKPSAPDLSDAGQNHDQTTAIGAFNR